MGRTTSVQNTMSKQGGRDFPMMNRRKFIYGTTCAAGTLTLARATNAFAAAATRYDLIIKGGRVFDRWVRLDGIRELAIPGGPMVVVEANIAAEAADTI